MQVSNRREQGERSRRYAVYSISRFVVSAPKADFRQQPFWGVGRLRLSSIRHAQPHVDKCIDSRLFCIHTNLGKVFFAELEYTQNKNFKEALFMSCCIAALAWCIEVFITVFAVIAVVISWCVDLFHFLFS